MYDLAITGGLVLDGTGSPPSARTSASRGTKLPVWVPFPRGVGRQEISADGLVSCPGFIDTHSHSDLMALAEPQLLPKIMQGITTELFGQDGIGAAPLNPGNEERLEAIFGGAERGPPHCLGLGRHRGICASA